MLPISFLSDYGHGDEFVGVCHGVIQRIAPGAVVIDVTHEVPRARGAGRRARPANAIPYLPQGVHLAVVDPGVGGERRAGGAALRATGTCSSDPTTACCGPPRRRAAASRRRSTSRESPHRLEPVSATFHGRDLFAPVAAHLALGAALEDAGRAARSRLRLSRSSCRRPSVSEGAIRTRVRGRRPLRQPPAQPARRRHARGRASSRASGSRCCRARRTGEAVYARTFARRRRAAGR